MEVENNTSIDTIEPVSQSTVKKSIDHKKIVQLLLNPLESLKLTDKDFLYGIMGLASSYVGYLIWSLFMAKRLNDLFNPLTLLSSFFSSESELTLFLKMYGKLMFVGLWSAVSLLVVIWLVSWWKSGSKQEIKSFITRIGGIQLLCGAGFILASIFSFNFSLSLFIVILTLISTLTLTLYAGIRLSNIDDNKISRYFVVSIAGYIVLMSFIPSLLI